MPRRKPEATPQLKRKVEKGRPDRAYVWLEGQRHYLGEHGSGVAEIGYYRLIGAWLENGRKLPTAPKIVVEMTIGELIAKYWIHCQAYYVKNGRPTDEQACIRAALNPVNALFGKCAIRDFTPPMLGRVLDSMIESGNSRGYINKSLGRIRRCFKWGASKGFVDGMTEHALRSVDGLRRGRTKARETSGVKPIEADVLNKTLEHCDPVLKSMIWFQRLTGCRPGEVCSMRPRDIEQSGEVWIYRPSTHKNEHRGQLREIYVNRFAQEWIAPGMQQPFVFLTPTGKQFNTSNYRARIHFICAAHQLPEWNPNQLRHNALTRVRELEGLETSCVIGGHAKIETTQIYAEANRKKAIEAIRNFEG